VNVLVVQTYWNPVKLIYILFQINLDQWKPQHDVEKDKMHWYLSWFSVASVACAIQTAIFATIHYIFFPDSNLYLLVRLMPEMIRNHWMTYIVHGCLWLWQLLALFAHLTFCFIVAVSYGVVIIPLVYTELVKGKKCYSTKCILRSTKYLIFEYRKLEILHSNVNESMGLSIIPLHALTENSILFCNYALFTMWVLFDGVTRALLIIFVVGLLVIWGSFLEGAGIFHMQAKALLESWRTGNWSKKDRLMMDKFRMSCRPLGIRSGNCFCVKRLSSLIFVQQIVVGTLRLFLTI
jgi:hypothetical protein